MSLRRSRQVYSLDAPPASWETIYLPRDKRGGLDFPRWQCDYSARMEVYAESGQNLERMADWCVELGLAIEDARLMLQHWSWSWQADTLIWLRALRGVPGARSLVQPQ